ncbi:helix-turn-helix transcriptional regulator [Priestia flexa]|jgi:DNA-binding XRE family transcriptional regulator|uniref:helix-turn-helix transcriptional regulator n=1 Tax=Priestia flexa TaxID=86664 RepID=UPI001CFE841E|nr:helix-turn-helix transcriptional regulator [Priestia flexa]MCG7314157.1 helix-turn-helix domain-containing protein [Priestia flexa]
MEWKNNIDFYVAKSGRSKKFIAKKLGISTNQFLAWRKGEYLPPVDKAILLAELLECSVYDLFKKTE